MLLNFGFRKINVKIFIYMIIILTLFMGILIDGLGFNSSIRYVNDFLILVLLIILLHSKNTGKIIKKINFKMIFLSIILFTIINIISAIINLVPINLLLWAIRNTYRFFIFYFATIILLEKKDIDKIINFMCGIQIINFGLILFQYFVLGLKQDSLGGIFGHGGNAGLLIYSTIILTYAIVKYSSKSISLYKFLFILMTTIISSVLAELRIFFILVAIMIVINTILSKSSIKKIFVVIGVILLFFVSVNLYNKIFPYVDLSINAFIEEGTSTGGGYNLSRLNGISEINSLFFKDKFANKIIGYGFGNCEYSNIDFFVSNFYKNFGHYNYRWFTHLWIFLETGYLGIFTYLLILVCILIQSIKIKKFKDKQEYYIISVILSITMIIMFLYNSLLKADFGYLAFLILAIPSIVLKSEQ